MTIYSLKLFLVTITLALMIAAISIDLGGKIFANRFLLLNLIGSVRPGTSLEKLEKNSGPQVIIV